MQSAYKAFHSTGSAFLHIPNDLLSAVDRNKGVILSAAWSVYSFWLRRSWDSLTRLCTGGTALTKVTWLISYLADHTQKVMINDTPWIPVHLHFDIPQGSVLGPLLFSIYILLIVDMILSINIIYMWMIHNSIYLLILSTFLLHLIENKKMERWIVEIQAWRTANKLNGDKIELIIPSSPFICQDINVKHIQVRTVTIRPSLSVHNMGVVFDCHLTMGNYVLKFCSTAYYNLRNVSYIQ